MSATLSCPSLAGSSGAPVAREFTDHSTNALVRQIAAAAERKSERQAERKTERRRETTYRPAAKGRPFQGWELALGAALLAGFAWAIWLQARPVPVEPTVAHYRSLAMTAGDGAVPAQSFIESSLLAIGREWSAATLFAHAHSRFWGEAKVTDPNLLARRVGDGLAQLSGQGRILSVTALDVPVLVTEAVRSGGTVLVGEVRGQIEFDNGTSLPFVAGLIREESAQKWGLTSLAVPPLLP